MALRNIMNNENVTTARTFWNMKINKIIDRFEQGIIDIETLVHELCLMGYEREDVLTLIDEDI